MCEETDLVLTVTLARPAPCLVRILVENGWSSLMFQVRPSLEKMWAEAVELEQISWPSLYAWHRMWKFPRLSRQSVGSSKAAPDQALFPT